MKQRTRTWTTRLSTFCLSGLLVAGTSIAQDDEPPVENSGESVEMTVIAGDGMQGAPMIIRSSQSFGADGTSSSMRIMSGAGGAMTFVGDGDFVMPAPDPWDMLNNPSVQMDLELVGDQLKQVQDLQADFAQQMKDQIGDIGKGGLSKEHLKELPELMKKLKAQQQEKMQGLLLPHQIERLQQVALQTHMKNAGAAGALASEQLAKELGISEDQIERLKERSKEINEKLAEDTKKLKEKAQQELLNELTPSQQAKLKEMIGQKYEPQTKDWSDSFNRRFKRPKSPNKD